MRSGRVFIFLIISSLVLLTWPVWRWLWGEWRSNEYYSHGFLIVPIAIFLAWRRLQNAEDGSWSIKTGDSWGFLLLASSLAAYLFFLTGRAYYLASFAVIGLIGGLIWTLAGASVVKRLVFPIGFLVLMVPLPLIEKTTLPLAQLTGILSGQLMNSLGLDVSVNGSAITLPNTSLVVGAQCSGVNSIIALLSLTLLTVYIFSGPWWGRVALVLFAIPFAIAGNIARVGSLLFVAHSFGVDAAFKFYHDFSGLLVFSVVILLMIPLMRLLQCRTVRSEVL